MKKILTVFLLFAAFSLAGCAFNQDRYDSGNDGVSPSEDNAETGPIGNDDQAAPAVNESYVSENLGIRIGYHSSVGSEINVREEGDRIYFYSQSSGGDYLSGQYLEKFSKDPAVDIETAIKERFLKEAPPTQGCFVRVTEDTDRHQKAIIAYADNICPDGTPAWNCAQCSPEYQSTNGISYFIYFKDQPGVYFFISIGQISLVMGSVDLPDLSREEVSRREWFNNIEFLPAQPASR